jgi:hypothetical protein
MALPFDLDIGEWWSVPRVGNTFLNDVAATPNAGGGEGVAGVINDWSGGCIDTKRKDLLIWGGGHAGYAGNEVYAFNFDPTSSRYLTWRRKSFYSVAANNDSETNADGSPASRHTYSGLIYSPTLDKMLSFPGGVVAGPSAAGAQGTFGFDCANETPNAAAPGAWTRYDDAPIISPDSTPNAYPNVAFDPTAGLYFSQHVRGFASFNPTLGAGSQWNVLSTFEGPAQQFQNTSEFAPISPRQMLWFGGNGDHVYGRRTDTNAYIGTESGGVPELGDRSILLNGSGSPGAVWDSQIQRIVMWDGALPGDSRDRYEYDPFTKVITRIAGAGDSPGAASPSGTFGRFRNLNACGAAFMGLNILVNSITTAPLFFRSSPAVVSSVPGISFAPNARRG